MCQFDAGPCLGGGPGRGTTDRPQAPASGVQQMPPWPSPGSSRPIEGDPKERRAGLWGSPRRTARGWMAWRIFSAPGWVTFYSNFGAQSCWLTGITAARREGGLTGAGRGRARCTVKFNSLNIPLLKAAA